MNKTMCLPGWSDLSKNEYRAYSQTEKRQYEKRLNMLCPSKELQRAAKEISEDIDTCSKCVYYCPNNENICHIPHTEAYMDALGIDPCYEGALLYLCKGMERKQQENGVTLDEIDKLLNDYRTAIYDNLVTIKSLTDLLIHVAPRGESLSKGALICAHRLNEKTQGIIDEWYSDCEDEDDYGFDDDCDYVPDYDDEDEDDDDYFDEDYDFDDYDDDDDE